MAECSSVEAFLLVERGLFSSRGFLIGQWRNILRLRLSYWLKAEYYPVEAFLLVNGGIFFG
jgi:hypothetical protein